MMIGSNMSITPRPTMGPGPNTSGDTYMAIPHDQLALMLRTRDADYAQLKASYTRVGVAAAALGVLSVVLGIAHLVRK